MSVIALIYLGPLTYGGELGEGYTIGHYVEGIGVGVLTSVRLVVWAAVLFSCLLSLIFSVIVKLHH